jgi:hypothetical protein
MKSSILFLPFHATSLLEMLPIAQKLADDDRYEPVFFIYRDISYSHLQVLRQQNFRMIGPKAPTFPQKSDLETSSSEVSPSSDSSQGTKTFRKRLVKKGLQFFPISFLFYFVLFGFQLISARMILRRTAVELLILIGDRHPGWETALVKIANQRGIPSLIVPFAISHPRSDAENRLRASDAEAYALRSRFDRYLSRKYPHWVYELDGRPWFFVPASIALAAKFWGMMPDNPWAIGGGSATQMAVESPKLKADFIEQGIPPEKMIVTGKPSIDQVYQLLHSVEASQIRQELGVSREQPLVLCSVPQLGEHGLLPWDQHWKEIEFLFSALAEQNLAPVVLSLHPKSKAEDYRPLIEKYGLILTNRRIYEILPLCDLFVATFSSVVMQAIGIGKPTVVVDFYGLGYTIYDQEPGVLVIRERAKLIPIMQRIISDRGYYQQLVQAQQKRAPEWILLDGRSTDRLIETIDQLIEKKDQTYGAG